MKLVCCYINFCLFDWTGIVVYTLIYTMICVCDAGKEFVDMMTAKIFENGRSQAVRLPKECRFDTDEVSINRIGDIVLLMPNTSKWNSFMQAIDMFSDDFMEGGRNDGIGQEREDL